MSSLYNELRILPRKDANGSLVSISTPQLLHHISLQEHIVDSTIGISERNVDSRIGMMGRDDTQMIAIKDRSVDSYIALSRKSSLKYLVVEKDHLWFSSRQSIQDDRLYSNTTWVVS